MAGRTFLDTNVLVYAVDSGEPVKRRKARRLIDEARSGELVVSAQVLAEFYVVVTRKLALPLDAAVAAQSVDRFSELHVVPVDSDLVRGAIALSRETELSYWDAAIVQAALIGGCDKVVTEDLAHGQVISTVRILDPFL